MAWLCVWRRHVKTHRRPPPATSVAQFGTLADEEGAFSVNNIRSQCYAKVRPAALYDAVPSFSVVGRPVLMFFFSPGISSSLTRMGPQRRAPASTAATGRPRTAR